MDLAQPLAASKRVEPKICANSRKLKEENERELNREWTRMDANILLPWTNMHGPSFSVFIVFASENFAS